MTSREEYIQELVDATNDTEDITGVLADSAYETLNELAQAIDTVQFTKITLSWGGPADYLEVKHQDGDVISVTYRYSDWFDTARREVSFDSPLYDYAIGIIDGLSV